jgi:hypothetical protein
LKDDDERAMSPNWTIVPKLNRGLLDQAKRTGSHGSEALDVDIQGRVKIVSGKLKVSALRYPWVTVFMPFHRRP